MGFKLAHELDRGGRYWVLVTTAGGLYRYHLRDEVEIVGFHHQCPLLRFLGKCDHGSDLVGEKLAEPHVRSVLERMPVLSRLRRVSRCWSPRSDRRRRYRLYLQGPSLDTCTHWLQELCDELQSGLKKTLTTAMPSLSDN